MKYNEKYVIQLVGVEMMGEESSILIEGDEGSDL